MSHRTLVHLVALTSLVGVAARSSAQPSARVAQPGAVALRFKTDTRDRRAEHIVALRRVGKIRAWQDNDGKAKTYYLELGHTTVSTDEIQIVTPHGVLAKNATPTPLALKDLTGPEVEQFLADKHGFALAAGHIDHVVPPRVLEASRFDLMPERLRLRFTVNPNFWARNVDRHEVPVREVRAIDRAGGLLDYYVTVGGQRYPNRERGLSGPWGDVSFKTGNFYSSMSSSHALTQAAVERYLADPARGLHFTQVRSDPSRVTGAELVDRYRALVVRDLEREGVVAVEWKGLEAQNDEAAEKARFGLAPKGKPALPR